MVLKSADQNVAYYRSCSVTPSHTQCFNLQPCMCMLIIASLNIGHFSTVMAGNILYIEYRYRYCPSIFFAVVLHKLSDLVQSNKLKV